MLSDEDVSREVLRVRNAVTNASSEGSKVIVSAEKVGIRPDIVSHCRLIAEVSGSCNWEQVCKELDTTESPDKTLRWDGITLELHDGVKMT